MRDKGYSVAILKKKDLFWRNARYFFGKIINNFMVTFLVKDLFYFVPGDSGGSVIMPSGELTRVLSSTDLAACNIKLQGIRVFYSSILEWMIPRG